MISIAYKYAFFRNAHICAELQHVYLHLIFDKGVLPSKKYQMFQFDLEIVRILRWKPSWLHMSLSHLNVIASFEENRINKETVRTSNFPRKYEIAGKNSQKIPQIPKCMQTTVNEKHECTCYLVTHTVSFGICTEAADISYLLFYATFFRNCFRNLTFPLQLFITFLWVFFHLKCASLTPTHLNYQYQKCHHIACIKSTHKAISRYRL